MNPIPIDHIAELSTVGSRDAVVHRGTRVCHHTGLAPDTEHEIDGFSFRTLPEPGELLATVATVNDVHFGEQRCGVVEGHPEIGPVLSAEVGEPPYPETMNRAAAAEVAALEPDAVLVKGDLTSHGTYEEYEAFLKTWDHFGGRLTVVRGNHESYHHLAVADEPVQCVNVPGANLVLLDTSLPGVEYGGVWADQLEALDAIAAEAHDAGVAVLVFGHHHPWNPASAERPDRYFGIPPGDAERLVQVVARRPAIRGYFAGHTHRNRVRRFPPTGDVPWVEVACVKDYPGSWAEYRIYEGGITQVHHRISSPEALAWTERTRHMYDGAYATYAFGHLADRCFSIPER